MNNADYYDLNSSPLGRPGGAGIYLHIPFCKQQCYYCDFHFSTSLKYKNEMVKALVRELELRKDELQSLPIETIYFGGGTPSILATEELKLILDTIDKHYAVCATPEVTLEANPDDLVSAGKSAKKVFREYQTIGINRLSIGIQSFFDEDLKSMNRAHNATEAKMCLQEATSYSDNITIDLIYGIPNMTKERWLQNLQWAFESGVNHISSYALTVEPKTALANFIKKGSYPPVSEDLALEHFNLLVAAAEKQGFIQYEISNFGKPGFFSRHNTSYWQGKKYLGIGPSAHSFDGHSRSWNVSNNNKYIKSLQEDILPLEKEELTDKDKFNEVVMTGLRTIWGVSLNTIVQTFGENYKEALLKNAEKFIVQDLLFIANEGKDSQSLKVTQKGKFLCDGIASELFLL